MVVEVYAFEIVKVKKCSFPHEFACNLFLQGLYDSVLEKDNLKVLINFSTIMKKLLF